MPADFTELAGANERAHERPPCPAGERRGSSSGILRVLLGALHDGYVNRLHGTVRFAQADPLWLEFLQLLLAQMQSKGWIYREGARRVWVLESSWRPVAVQLDAIRVRVAYARGYFNAEGSVPRSASDGEMEQVLWQLSRLCQEPLLGKRTAPTVEALVWTVKSWWGVQGVSSDTRAIMCACLAWLPWSEALFTQPSEVPADADRFATDLVAELVARCCEAA